MIAFRSVFAKGKVGVTSRWFSVSLLQIGGPFFAATGLTPGSLSPRRSIILTSFIQCMFSCLKSSIPSFYRCVQADFVSFLVLSFLSVKMVRKHLQHGNQEGKCKRL